MVSGVEYPKTRATCVVRSTKYMDHAITDLTSKSGNMSTVLDELRSVIAADGFHVNREGNNHGDHRFCTKKNGFFVIMIN